MIGTGYLSWDILDHCLSSRVAVCGLVSTIGQVTSLLKLNREEEGGGNIDAFELSAIWFGGTVINIVHPIAAARILWFAIKEVYVLLAHKKERLVNRVAGRVPIVVDENGRRGRSPERCCGGWIAQSHKEMLSNFAVVIINERNTNYLEGLAGSKFQASDRGDVVATSRRAATNNIAAVTDEIVAGGVINRRNSAGVNRSRNQQRD